MESVVEVIREALVWKKFHLVTTEHLGDVTNMSTITISDCYRIMHFDKSLDLRIRGFESQACFVMHRWLTTRSWRRGKITDT
jgi:hypothetical protein